jgi:hypothetical protein
MQSVRILVVVGFVAAAAGACRETPLLAPMPGAQAGVPGGTVRAEITEEALEADGALTLVVRVRARNAALSAYQGAVTFTPGAFELVSISAPERAGESYLFNPTEFEAGRIRFAAMSPVPFADVNAVGGIEAFRVTVRPLRPLAEANLAATVDIASLENGASLTSEQLLPSRYLKGGTRRSK